MSAVAIARWTIARKHGDRVDGDGATLVGVGENAHGALVHAAGGGCDRVVVVDGLWGPWRTPAEEVDAFYALVRGIAADPAATGPAARVGARPARDPRLRRDGERPLLPALLGRGRPARPRARDARPRARPARSAPSGSRGSAGRRRWSSSTPPTRRPSSPRSGTGATPPPRRTDPPTPTVSRRRIPRAFPDAEGPAGGARDRRRGRGRRRGARDQRVARVGPTVVADRRRPRARRRSAASGPGWTCTTTDRGSSRRRSRSRR